MFIKNITIKNFRCFVEKTITLNIPDGNNIGSGLNVFVGKNGSGKTTILDAIDLMTRIPQYAKTKLKITDFNKIDKDIEIICESSADFSVPRLYGNNNFISNGITFSANVKKVDNSSYLVDCLSMDSKFILSASEQSNINDIELRVANTKPNGTNRLLRLASIKYFDKNRTKHLDSGTFFDTQLNNVIDEINFQYLHTITNSNNPNCQTVKKFINETAKKLSKAYGSLNDKIIENFKAKTQKLINISPNLYFINQAQPFLNTIIGIDGQDDNIKIPLASTGSGIGMICSFLFLDTIYELDQIDTVYIIDEPELHLHPQLQNLFFKLLLTISQHRQVIISTHSPNFASLKFPETIFHFTEKYQIEHIVDQTKIDYIKSKEKNIMSHQRNMLFADFVIFFEGTEDLERYSIFCKENDMETLTDHFYIMNGCEQTKLFKTIATEFGIDFYAIVDDDYIINKHIYDRTGFKKALDNIKQFCIDKNINFNERKFDRELAKEIRTFSRTPRAGRQTENITSNYMRIRRIVDSGIFVLKKGKLEDYLDNLGHPVNDNARKELLAIFKFIAKNHK